MLCSYCSYKIKFYSYFYADSWLEESWCVASVDSIDVKYKACLTQQPSLLQINPSYGVAPEKTNAGEAIVEEYELMDVSPKPAQQLQVSKILTCNNSELSNDYEIEYI